MLPRVRKTIEHYAMLERGERLIVAVSGGSDSVALLKMLTLIAADYELSLVVAHLNHCLRGKESDREEEFVRNLSHTMGLKCLCERIDMDASRQKGKSLEEFCRDERYYFLKKVAADFHATKIVLGHHLHDQAETVLMNLFRGSGSDGLRGMLPVREGLIIRPLLYVTKEEILAFLKEMGLPFMNDSSNINECHLRNRIRHQLIPHLEKGFNPKIVVNLSHTAEILRRDGDYLEKEVAGWLLRQGIDRRDGEIQLLIPELLKLHEALQYRVIKTLLIWSSQLGKGVGYKHIQAVLKLAQEEHGSASLNLPGNVLLQREYGMLRFSRESVFLGSPEGSQSSGSLVIHYPVTIPGKVEVKEAGMTINFQIARKTDSHCFSLNKRIACLDYDALLPPLFIRNVKPGDVMQPLGMTGNKKLKSLFIDEKVPCLRRKLIPILADQKSVIWVAGLRMSDRVGVTDKTCQVLKVEIV